MTNEEYIRQMDSIELAEFLYNVGGNTTQVTNCFGDCKLCEEPECYCICKIMEWLSRECE